MRRRRWVRCSTPSKSVTRFSGGRCGTMSRFAVDRSCDSTPAKRICPMSLPRRHYRRPLSPAPNLSSSSAQWREGRWVRGSEFQVQGSEPGTSNFEPRTSNLSLFQRNPLVRTQRLRDRFLYWQPFHARSSVEPVDSFRSVQNVLRILRLGDRTTMA